jgi:hypothetical protein
MGHGARSCISRLSPGETSDQTASVVDDLMGAHGALAARSGAAKIMTARSSQSMIRR